jgi:hypothetical protein
MKTVSAMNGMVSARNAGAMAAPADAVPSDPSTAGITHHQGNGKIGAMTLFNGFSTLNSFKIVAPPLAA